jgi:hypothetical protein
MLCAVFITGLLVHCATGEYLNPAEQCVEDQKAHRHRWIIPMSTMSSLQTACRMTAKTSMTNRDLEDGGKLLKLSTTYKEVGRWIRLGPLGSGH